MKGEQHSAPVSANLHARSFRKSIPSSFASKSGPLLTFAIILLFLFSNLIDRIKLVGASAAFFVVVGLAVAIHCMSARLVKWQYAVIGVAAYFALFPLLRGEGVLVTLAAIKDLALPLSGVLLGSLILCRNRSFEILNCLYLPFVAYGLLQAGASHMNMLGTLLPWDAAYVEQMRTAGMSVYQTNVLRIFGTLNSFFHYQLICVFVPILLWVRRDQIQRQRLLWLNTALACIFLAILQERTPVAVLTIFSLVAIVFGTVRIRLVGLAGLAIVATLAGTIGIFGGTGASRQEAAQYRTSAVQRSAPSTGGASRQEAAQYRTAAENESDADLRMRNMVMLRVDNDTSVKERLVIWREMLTMITLENIWFGRSPAQLLPGNEAWSKGHYLSPHNVYLFFVLAYGVVGLTLYFGVLARLLWSAVGSGRLEPEMRLFVSGICIVYLFLGVFHLSFLSKLGFFLCWILGLALSDRDAACEASCRPCRGEAVDAGGKVFR